MHDGYAVDIQSTLLPFVSPHRDPLKRPSAKEALQHPWLQDGSVAYQRCQGKPLNATVVQRLQVMAFEGFMYG